MTAQPIATAPRDEAAYILVSSTGSVWFQASWDPEDETFITFNRYVEDHMRGGAGSAPTWSWWTPLPELPA